MFMEDVANSKNFRKSKKQVKAAIEEISSKIGNYATTNLETIEVNREDFGDSVNQSIYIVIRTGKGCKDRLLYKYVSGSDSDWKGIFVPENDMEDILSSMRENQKKIPHYRKSENRINVDEDEGTAFYDQIIKYSNNCYTLYRETGISDDMAGKICQFDKYYFTRAQLEKMQDYFFKKKKRI